MRDEPIAKFTAAEGWGPGYQLWEGARRFLAQRGPDGTTSLVRFASHIAVIVIVLLVLVVARVQLPEWELNAEIIETEGEVVTQVDAGAPTVNRMPSTLQALVRAAVPLTMPSARPAASTTAGIAPLDRPRDKVVQYAVQEGDTLYGIADRYGISADTLVWSNNLEQNPDLLRLGQELAILPIDGVLHDVKQGETLATIAKKYKVDPSAILGFAGNGLADANQTLTVGQKLVVPGGTKPRVVRQVVQGSAARTAKAPSGAPVGAGRLIWPVGGGITQSFRAYHRAVDIGARSGNAVHAADAGYVMVAGWSNLGYGNHVIIDHGNGITTLYAHLSKINVEPGQTVEQGTVIGFVGSTGRSTGPHLHFEVRVNGGTQNPFNYLP